ncbi:MAG: hypothetical protein ACYC27_23100 [Armatimonadota bacterium]
MKQLFCCIVILMYTLISASLAKPIDLKNLPAEKVPIKVILYNPDNQGLPGWMTSDAMPFVEKAAVSGYPGHIPDELFTALKSLTKDDNLLLYVYSGEGVADDEGNLSLTQDAFPYDALAKAVNSLPCRYVITIFDLPTTPSALIVDKPVDLFKTQNRCALFRKGMTIFTSRSLDKRLIENEEDKDVLFGLSTFFQYFIEGMYQGFANSDGDDNITLWEAYEYAYWCTYARGVRDGMHPQVPVYTLTENWTMQPVLGYGNNYPRQADPQLVLFAQVNLRKPATRGVSTPLGPPGPSGKPGPSWMSWYQGPLPQETASISDWAWHALRILEEKVVDIEKWAANLQRLAAMGCSPEGLTSEYELNIRLYPALQGPDGSPGWSSKEVMKERDAMIASINDAKQRNIAKANSELLQSTGMMAQKLQIAISDVGPVMIRDYSFAPSTCKNDAEACRVPEQWPEKLGVPVFLKVRGVAGVQGPMVGPTRYPDSRSAARGTAKSALWSVDFTSRINSIKTRLEKAEKINLTLHKR